MQARGISHNRTAIWAAAAVVVAVIVGLAVVLVVRNANLAAPPLAAPTTQPPASSAPAEASQTARVVTETDLQRQVDADRAVAEELLGYWVPQLSSKQPGRTVHGMTFDFPAILADFQALHTRFPQSVLIRSDDYSSYLHPGYWVTVVAETYASADVANAWCDANGFAAEDCYAHRLSHTDGPTGSSKLRR